MKETPLESSHPLQLPNELALMLPKWSKSNVIKFLGLGMLTGSTVITDSLHEDKEAQPYGEDIEASLNVSHQWEHKLPLNPGDSRTLLILTKMLIYLETEKYGDQGRELVHSEMQRSRNIEDDPQILNMKASEMLSLSGGTTQWAGAAILLQGREDEINDLMKTARPDQRFMLQKSIDIRRRWLSARVLGKKLQLDERDSETTITRQARHHFTQLVTGVNTPFIPQHSEDVFMAIFTGAITPEEALELYPQIISHETNRYAESIKIMESDVIDTLDHRGAQAGMMCFPEKTWTKRTERAIRKTTPRFFEYLKLAEKLASSHKFA